MTAGTSCGARACQEARASIPATVPKMVTTPPARSAPVDPVLVPGGLRGDALGGRRRRSGGAGSDRHRRAALAGEVAECRRETRLVRIAERVAEVVAHEAAGQRDSDGARGVGGGEAVRVVAEVLLVHSLEL